jgi:DNA-binding XRE family transcriptional regulator
MTAKVLSIKDNYYYFSSQQKLADYLGVKVNTIYRWNREGKNTAFNGLIRIEDYNPNIHTKIIEKNS